MRFSVRELRWGKAPAGELDAESVCGTTLDKDPPSSENVDEALPPLVPVPPVLTASELKRDGGDCAPALARAASERRLLDEDGELVNAAQLA